MSFGLHGVAHMFQRLRDKILQPLADFALAYIDDIMVFSQTWVEYLEHIKAVLLQLQEYELTAKSNKCHIASYVGYIVVQGQLQAQPNKAQALKQVQQPADKKGLQRTRPAGPCPSRLSCEKDNPRGFAGQYPRSLQSLT